MTESRPNPGVPGRTFMGDSGVVWFDNGTEWIKTREYYPSSGCQTLALSTTGNFYLNKDPLPWEGYVKWHRNHVSYQSGWQDYGGVIQGSNAGLDGIKVPADGLLYCILGIGFDGDEWWGWWTFRVHGCKLTIYINNEEVGEVFFTPVEETTYIDDPDDWWHVWWHGQVLPQESLLVFPVNAGDILRVKYKIYEGHRTYVWQTGSGGVAWENNFNIQLILQS